MSFPNFNGAGLTLIHNENNNISILMAKSNSDKINKKNVWIFPGGRKNDNELPHETAYREFIEEVFNVVVNKSIIDEIIDLVKKNKSLYPIDTLIPNNSLVPSYTLMQSSEVITDIVNVLNKHRIVSDVFPFGYNSLYNNQKKVNIYQFCAQRRYIYEPASFEKNELVFITMIPLNNLIYSVYRTKKHKEVFHYHGENLKIHVPSIMNQIKSYVNKLNTNEDDNLCNILIKSCGIVDN
jgi:hypothetical protein